MPRTRRSSLSLSQSNRKSVDEKMLANPETTQTKDIAAKNKAKYKTSANATKLNKKRTISDRSPVVKTKSRKKTSAAPSEDVFKSPFTSPTRNDDKENVTPVKMGVTPYWKVALERGISPPLTRSAIKKPPSDDIDNSESSPNMTGNQLFPEDDRVAVSAASFHEMKREIATLRAEKEYLKSQFTNNQTNEERVEISDELREIKEIHKELDGRLQDMHNGLGDLKSRRNTAQNDKSNAHDDRAYELEKENQDLRTALLHQQMRMEKEKDAHERALRAAREDLEDKEKRLGEKDELFQEMEEKSILETRILGKKLEDAMAEMVKIADRENELRSRLEEHGQEPEKKSDEGKLKALREQNDCVHDELKTVKEELKRKEAKIKSMERGSTDSNTKQRELETQVKRFEEALSLMEERKIELENAFETMQSNYESEKTNTTTLEEELMLCCEESEEFKARLEASIHDQATLSEEKIATEKEKEELESALKDSEEKFNAMNKNILCLKDDLQSSQEQAETAKKLLKDSREEVDVLNTDVHRLKTQSNVLQSTIDQMQKDRDCREKEHNHELAVLRGEIERLNAQCTQMSEKVSHKDKNICEVTKRCRLMMQSLDKYNAREGELLNKIYLQDQVRRSLHNKVIQLSGNIRVFIRVRPRIANEQSITEEADSHFTFPSIFEASSNSAVVGIGDDLTKKFVVATEPVKDRGGLSQRRKRLKFGFDNVFSPKQGQDDIWKAADPLIQSAVDGYNVCVFAYGQTGSGKTYTMLGTKQNPGLLTKAISKMFDSKRSLEETSKGALKVDISIELLEIYNEQVRDLMSVEKDGSDYKCLNISLNSNEAVGNKVVPASDEQQVFSFLELAQGRRCVKATKSNEESSRSHMIFTLNFVAKNGTEIVRNSKLHVCDLAGSERLSKSHSSGSTLTETKHINKSLSTLSNVIEKLQQKSSHIPFRESKLTYLLRNSLGGDSKTLAIVCCNPLSEHFQESTCSLRFAQKLNKVELKALGNVSC